MPTVFEKDGFKFFSYRNDSSPIRHGGGEAVFDVENMVGLGES